MTITITILIALALVAATVLIHYEVLRLAGRLLPRLPIRPRQRVVVVIAMCLFAHLVEIALYAAAFALLCAWGFGEIQGEFDGSALAHFYFSSTCYTTLGIGDVYPKGPLRLVVGVQSLNGFLLITWSASFTYLSMQRWWHTEMR